MVGLLAGRGDVGLSVCLGPRKPDEPDNDDNLALKLNGQQGNLTLVVVVVVAAVQIK